MRCCFISPFARAQTYAKNKLIINASKDSFKEAASINYTIDGDIMLHIPGIVRYLLFLHKNIQSFQLLIENLHAKFFSNKILMDDQFQH